MSSSEDKLYSSTPVFDLLARRPVLTRIDDTLKDRKLHRSIRDPYTGEYELSSSSFHDTTPKEGAWVRPKIEGLPDFDYKALRRKFAGSPDWTDLAGIINSDDALAVGDSPRQIRSETNVKYAERLSHFEFGVVGNPHLKTTIQRRVEEWEDESRWGKLSALATLMEMSVAEVEELLQKRVEELMERCHFFRATQTEVFLNHIISGEQRYKSQFETGTSNGILWPEHRSKIEAQICGFPRYDTPEGQEMVKDRPIYGYFSLDKNGIFNHSGAHPPKNNVRKYGGITVKIKREAAIQRATISFKDSLDSRLLSLVPAALPHYSALFTPSHDYGPKLEMIRKFLEQPLDNRTLQEISTTYTEVQFHGGLSVDDINSVHMSLGNKLSQTEIDRVTAAIGEYNRETGRNIPVIIY